MGEQGASEQLLQYFVKRKLIYPPKTPNFMHSCRLDLYLPLLISYIALVYKLSLIQEEHC